MTKLKKTAMAFGTACALAFTGGISALNAFQANATVRATGDRKYYGAKLSDEIAGAFYDELVAMTVDPDGNGEQLSEFRNGATHTVQSQAILDAAAGYEDGSVNLVKQFGAALDSFRYDYTELFYVNFDLLNFNVTKTSTENPEQPDPDADSDEDTDAQAEGEAEYSVTIGAGRATNYFLYNLTAEELNGENGIFEEYTKAKTVLLDGDGANKKGVKTLISEAGATSVKDKAIVVNQYIADNFRYGYDFNSDGSVSGVDRFVTTTGSIVTSSATAKCYANSEGLARVYKMIMNELGISCELVSGYYVSGSTVKAEMWNYVQDGSDWYAVDVANNITTNNKYLYLSGEIFSLDHFEDGIVSLSNYKLTYPQLTVNNYNVETGELQIANGIYENRNGIAVAYTGNRGKLAFRIKGDDGVWSEWTTFEEYMKTDGPEETPEENPDGNPEETPEALAEEDETNPDEGGNTGDEGTEDGDTGNEGDDGNEGEEPPVTPEPEEPDPEVPEPTYNIAEKDGIYYLFNLAGKNFQIGILNEKNECVEYSETVKESFGTGVVPIPITANPERLEAQDIMQSFNVQITYPVDLKRTDSTDVIEYTVSSPFGDPVNEEFVKENSKIENVIWSSDSNTLSFTFTPSSLLEHNGLRYSFSPANLVSVETEAVPQPYSVIFKFNEIRASGVFGGSNYYTDVVSQPSLVYNNALSLSGWTYNNGVSNVNATDNMRATLALSVFKPVSDVDTSMTDAVKAKIAESTTLFQSNAYLANENYIMNLTLDGESVKIPDGTHLSLAFPYPDGYGPENTSAAYRVLQFPMDARGVIDYENPEIIDAIGLRQGIIANVNSFSAFALVVIDSGKVISPYANSILKSVYTVTTGVGGTITAAKGAVTTDKTLNTAQGNVDTIVYTITAKEGYKLDFVTLNGVDKTGLASLTSSEGEPATYRLSIAYSELTYESRPSATNVLQIEFIAESAADGFTAVANAVAKDFVIKQLSQTAYSEDEKNEIIRDYPSGGAIFTPSEPPIEEEPPVFSPKSTQMQLLIVLGVVGAFAVIGAIAIVYCAAIRPKIIREREEEAARIAANRERRANRNRMQSMGGGFPRDPQNPRN